MKFTISKVDHENVICLKNVKSKRYEKKNNMSVILSEYINQYEYINQKLIWAL